MLSTEPSLRITAYKTTSPSTRSLINVGGYFGSIFLRGPGAETSEEAGRGPSEFTRSSEKFRIQLPGAPFRWGMFPGICSIFFEAKTCSGPALAGRDAQVGGPVLWGASSSFVCGSGLVIRA